MVHEGEDEEVAVVVTLQEDRRRGSAGPKTRSEARLKHYNSHDPALRLSRHIYTTSALIHI